MRPEAPIDELQCAAYRIEQTLFDGFVEPVSGVLTPDRTRPGLGVELERADAERYAI